MCGRYACIEITPEDLQSLGLLSANMPAFRPRYNIAPNQTALVIPNNNPRVLRHFRWGLVPAWAKDPKMGARMINARSETLLEKPSFKDAFRKRRCLVPCSGFFEWQHKGSKKQPFYIRMASNRTFAFAGLWESWTDSDSSHLYTFTIITTRANRIIGPIHDRMPVIIAASNYDLWLEESNQSLQSVSNLLCPYPHDEMEAFPVSTLVNRPSNDFADIIKPDHPTKV